MPWPCFELCVNVIRIYLALLRVEGAVEGIKGPVFGEVGCFMGFIDLMLFQKL